MRRLSPPRSGRRGLALAAIACLLLAALVQGRIEARAASRPGVHPLLYLPSGKYLRVAALGFDGILADAIYLCRSSITGTSRSPTATATWSRSTPR